MCPTDESTKIAAIARGERNAQDITIRELFAAHVAAGLSALICGEFAGRIDAAFSDADVARHAQMTADELLLQLEQTRKEVL